MKILLSLLGDKCPDLPGMQGFLMTLAKKYPQVIHLEGEALSVTELIEHHIAYEGKAIWFRQRPIVMSKLRPLLKTIDKLLRMGSIGPSDAEYNFPIVPVWKSSTDEDGDRELRLTVDYSAINKLTKRDRISVPGWDEFTGNLHNSTVFSKIYLYV